ncbi:MAG: radical SAM protein [Deltaproteobacteria bacterium]|nr:radical SAM protein [Deltaproteobacteria bacterium]
MTAPAPSIAASASLRRKAVLQAQVMFTCNNRCWFCLDRNEVDGEFHGGPAVVPFEVIAALLRDHAGTVDAVMFTHGEPTLHPALPRMLALARVLGFAGRGVVTNGRRLADAGRARTLCEAGANRFVVSIHGLDAATHDASVGRPAFVEAAAGLANLAACKADFEVELTTSTVASRLNLPRLADTVRWLLGQGADTAVVNVVRPTGHARKHFDAVVPRHAEVVAALAPLWDAPDELRRRVVLEDIPPCAAGPWASLVGSLEAWVVPKTDESARAPRAKGLTVATAAAAPDPAADAGRAIKRAECARCAAHEHCWGVWESYAAAFGWDEFSPIAPAAAAGGGAFEREASVLLAADRLAAALPQPWRLTAWTLDGRRERLRLRFERGAAELEAIVESAAAHRPAWIRRGRWAWSHGAGWDAGGLAVLEGVAGVGQD